MQVMDKSDAPKGMSNFWYVHISLHKNGLHLFVQLCQYFVIFLEIRIFLEK